MSLRWCVIFFILGIQWSAYGQVVHPADSLKTDSLRAGSGKRLRPVEDLGKQFDFTDLTRSILHPHREVNPMHNRSGITVVPNIAANPTIGGQLGIKAVAGRRLGNDSATLFSVGATSASITTKGIIYFYINHNVFTPGNKWNLQGNLVVAKTVTPDFGYGIGRGLSGGTKEDSVLGDPTHKGYLIRSYYYNVREKVYKNVAKNLFVGAGLSFEIRRHINSGDTTNNATPSSVYDNRHGFPKDRYSANGFLFNIEYITRDNPNRAYKGIFFDAGVRVNQTWIGSTKNSVQLTSDFRKYFSLSAASPEFVLAFWNWGSYLVSGDLPYLELPGTARDGSYRSGRGYTAQYFKGTQFNDTELELRFPILANKFISGVSFANLQTGNDEHGTKIFQVFQPGYGAGLRVLFNKHTRTNLALDYAFGRFGRKGFFLNLNETF
ncbi:MAG: BamA/TamA family outer membrane protein [Bacteroidetes bacterium]|nr:BamA/TamA family outer membrane protein [Bacteroidota bacterium]